MHRSASLPQLTGWMALSLASCTANISSTDRAPGPPGETPPSMSGAGGSAGAATGSGPLDPETGLPETCANASEMSAPAPLTRLTNREYRNTLTDLFPEAKLEAPSLPVENKDDGFDNVAKNQAPTAAWVEGYFKQAGSVARTVGASVVSACPASDDACVEAAILELAERVFRKPLETGERTRLTSLLTDATTRWGRAKGVEVALRGLLQTPQFLYRLEHGVAEPGKQAAPLSGYELAARLSYLLWDTMPDDELYAAASSGALADVDNLEAQARRLLESPRAHEAVAVFHAQWLRFEKMATLSKSPELFPSFDAATADALRASTERFVELAFWEKRSLDAFLTSTSLFANAALAPLLGVRATGSELTEVQAPPDQRAGILTQPGLLAGFAHETVGSPVLRGVFVLDRLLCSAPPPPPPDVPPAPTSDSAGSPTTTRQKFEQHLNTPACSACHKTIDGIGFGFENYDAVGQYRTEEAGIAVDATGQLLGTLDADGPFTGAVELGQRLAQSKQTQACVARYWYRYAFGLSNADVDACSLYPVVRDFEARGRDLPELVLAIVRSNSFRTRKAVSP